jgi:hypothetical protein
MVLYHDDTVDKTILNRLKLNGVILKQQPKSQFAWMGTFWRFEELLNANADRVVIIQDADCPLDVENGVVKKMLNRLIENDGGCMLHHGIVSTGKIEKDEKWMMASQIQVRQGIDFDFKDSVESYLSTRDLYDSDEMWLRDNIWPLLKENCYFNIESRVLPNFKNLVNRDTAPSWMQDDDEFNRRVCDKYTEK